MILPNGILLRDYHPLRINLLSIDNQRVEEHALTDFIASEGNAIRPR